MSNNVKENNIYGIVYAIVLLIISFSIGSYLQLSTKDTIMLFFILFFGIPISLFVVIFGFILLIILLPILIPLALIKYLFF